MARVALLFDLDGTIWNCDEWYASLARLQSGVAHGGANAAVLLKSAGFTPARFRAQCRSDDPPIPLFPEVAETIGRLRELGAALGVATNLPDWMASPMLDAAGLSDHLSAVVTWGTTSRRKPHPDPLLAAMRQLGLSCHERHWYVGDSVADCQAAKAAGLSFAFAGWGATGAPSDADLILDRPSDLARLAAGAR